MAESEIKAIKQTNQLKDRIDNKHKALPWPERLTASLESLVTFQDLEDLPLVVQQWEFEIQWKQNQCLILLHRWHSSLRHWWRCFHSVVECCKARCATGIWVQWHLSPDYTPCPDAITGAFRSSESCHRWSVTWYWWEEGILHCGGVCSPLPETVTHWGSCQCTYSCITESPRCTSDGPLSTASVKCRGVLPLPNEWCLPGIAFQHGSGWSHTASLYTNPSLWWICCVAAPPVDTSIWPHSNVASTIQSWSQTSQCVSTQWTTHVVDQHWIFSWCLRQQR